MAEDCQTDCVDRYPRMRDYNGMRDRWSILLGIAEDRESLMISLLNSRKDYNELYDAHVG